MKDLKMLAQECMRELDSIGIPYGTVRSWTVNTRAKKRWGLCTALPGGKFDISIAAVLLEDNADDLAAKNTIIHELLHTVPGCVGHQQQWKAFAGQVNRMLPQYHITRTAAPAEKGVSVPPPVVRYCLECKKCGRQFLRTRYSKTVAHPELYRCRCGGQIRRIR